MKYSCHLIQDLLPLYADGVCSADSEAAVKEHLSGCEACRKMLAEIKSDTLGNSLAAERSVVLERHEKKEKRKAVTVGGVFACILTVPLIVCLIVNLATGAALDWFFIVLCALLLTASLTVLPMMIEQNRFATTFGAFTLSLILLLLTCALYTGGDWFFVAASATLFGLSVIFTPILLAVKPLKFYVRKYRGTLALTVDTLLYALMMVVIGFHTESTLYPRLALGISIRVFGVIWLFALLLLLFKKRSAKNKYKETHK